MPAKKSDNLNVLKMRNYCLKCGKKGECKSLCSIAEGYVNQDYCERVEMLLNSPEIWTDIGSLTGIDPLTSQDLKKIIIELYLSGKNAYDIKTHIYYSRQHIDRIIQEYRKLCKEKP
uniref:Uncharacterized protein n=1 Tax=viral metagenome TaxID=1070528 RepID=A0A6M3LDW9_9ZZZZ